MRIGIIEYEGSEEMAKKNADMRFEREKKRRRSILIALILLLLGIIMIIIGSYAFYTTTITGTISGTIANWSFKANNATSTFNITLKPTQSVTANSKIAPGTSGSFSVVLKNEATLLGVDYTLTFSDFTNIPSNLKFYNDSTFATVADITSSTYSLTGTLAANSSITKTWYWKWPYGDASSITNDNSAAEKNITFKVNVVGVQKNQ